MKIIDGIKQPGRPFEIPDCSRDDLPGFFREMGYKTGVELGVYKGEFTKKLLEAGLKIYGIDPWGNYMSEKNYPKFRTRQQFLFEHARRYLDKYLKNGQCELIRETSMNAIGCFKNETLDFIYIDADHRFKYIAEDLYEWPWKIRKGGAISGHDYLNTLNQDYYGREHHNNIVHVGAVVDAYTKCFVPGSWYLIGRRRKVENEKRDKWLSWLWLKE